jgi:V/A-type H+/Na+-transporting ATPase subunit E
MKTLDPGKEKIKKICDILRDETLEPAQKEAQQIIEKAQQEADRLNAQAHREAEKLRSDAKAAIEKDLEAFHASLQQAARQGLETLRQNIEHKVFNEHLPSLIEKEMDDCRPIADLINVIVKALEKEGLAADLTVLVPQNIPAQQINGLLLKEVLKSLTHQSVTIGNFNAGVQLKVNNKKLTIDISSEALKELLGTNIFRKDFRKLIFQQP